MVDLLTTHCRRRANVNICRLLVVAAIVASAHGAFGQRSAPFVQRSTLPTPVVRDTAVLRQQRLEAPPPASLTDPLHARVLELELFRDVAVRAIRDRVEPTANGWAWFGTLDGYPGSNVVFVTDGREVAGDIYAPFGFFRVVPQRDGSYLAEQRSQSAALDASDALVPSRGSTGAASKVLAPAAVSTDNGGTIDVLFAVTGDAYAALGGELRMLLTINLAVMDANQALRNTGLDLRFQIVHTAVVRYTESGSSITDLDRLRYPNDGFLDDVATLRDRYGADLVVFVPERTDTCGRGYLNRPTSALNGEYGFSSVQRRCLGGGPLAHEIGHNLGAMHDWYDEADGGAYPYAKGYISVAGRFRDLMSQGAYCVAARIQCPNLLTYSNPRITYTGYPTGVAVGTSTACRARDVQASVGCDADVALAFTRMAPVVARYRQSRADVSPRVLLARQTLAPGTSLRSSNGQFRLQYQTDGNLVLYDDVNRRVLWATGSAVTDGRLVMEGDGNLVLYDGSGASQWMSGTGAKANTSCAAAPWDAPCANTFLVLQDDGNLVIYRRDGSAVWSQNQ